MLSSIFKITIYYQSAWKLILICYPTESKAESTYTMISILECSKGVGLQPVPKAVIVLIQPEIADPVVPWNLSSSTSHSAYN